VEARNRIGRSPDAAADGTGEVRLAGCFDTRCDAEVLPRFVRSVPGVVQVESHEPDLDE
jgi:hypothetical protein